jgi:hypothetical protein
LFLPLRFNVDDPVSPGDHVPAASFAALEQLLLDAFGGYSRRVQAPPIVEGRWRDPGSGRVYADRSRAYEIVTERRRSHEMFFLRLHAWALREFRQEEIFLLQEAVRLAERTSAIPEPSA